MLIRPRRPKASLRARDTCASSRSWWWPKPPGRDGARTTTSASAPSPPGRSNGRVNQLDEILPAQMLQRTGDRDDMDANEIISVICKGGFLF